MANRAPFVSGFLFVGLDDDRLDAVPTGQATFDCAASAADRAFAAAVPADVAMLAKLFAASAVFFAAAIAMVFVLNVVAGAEDRPGLLQSRPTTGWKAACCATCR